jgi:hypothetical protein
MAVPGSRIFDQQPNVYIYAFINIYIYCKKVVRESKGCAFLFGLSLARWYSPGVGVLVLLASLEKHNRVSLCQ